ncbi:hypothetical protein Asulf_01251 [Archaeoglobus sulfaticallidus PM70-1]|uniref:Uncharacterized protein n=1 Tax=Archaeoglobus sulfaticallidus PM70-1 TaxID=387631 RepID=N0BG18_9EURY|nr:hypothetical protein [Archaeoglobus sulfaticallidus]AGK61247.1 hypothetical protein Asulf_01251 [Archaeoglobus sulfaticallidus PM70-1]
MSEFKLGDIFGCEAVKNFGAALRKALRIGDDYASLVELEYVETKEQFEEVIKKFLRRYETIARRGYKGKELSRLSEKDLEELMGLVDKYDVKPIRAALISYALVKSEREDETTFESEEVV